MQLHTSSPAPIACPIKQTKESQASTAINNKANTHLLSLKRRSLGGADEDAVGLLSCVPLSVLASVSKSSSCIFRLLAMVGLSKCVRRRARWWWTLPKGESAVSVAAGAPGRMSRHRGTPYGDDLTRSCCTRCRITGSPSISLKSLVERSRERSSSGGGKQRGQGERGKGGSTGRTGFKRVCVVPVQTNIFSTHGRTEKETFEDEMAVVLRIWPFIFGRPILQPHNSLVCIDLICKCCHEESRSNSPQTNTTHRYAVLSGTILNLIHLPL